MSCFDRIKGKKVSVDTPATEPASKQPQYGMPYLFYEN